MSMSDNQTWLNRKSVKSSCISIALSIYLVGVFWPLIPLSSASYLLRRYLYLTGNLYLSQVGFTPFTQTHQEMAQCSATNHYNMKT